VIILTNKGNSKRIEIQDAIVNILHGKPFTFPKISLAEALYDKISKQGIQHALQFYDSLKTSNNSLYDFGEAELNSLGYQLLGEKKNSEAIEVFTRNTIMYPTSSNAFDSLAEAYKVNGNKDLAIQYYRKAIELDPSNLNSINMLKKLE
jgi:tetratricopeptide (TPR) repeat protein